jgi:arginine decarboxylase
MAQRRTSEIGHEVWAGLGWVQEADTGRGLFAEAMGASESEVRLQLASTLGEMVEARKGDWSQIETVVTGATCKGRPICALVAAAYESQGWSS